MTFAAGILLGAFAMLLLSAVVCVVLVRAARKVPRGFEIAKFQAEQGARFADELSRTSETKSAARF